MNSFVVVVDVVLYCGRDRDCREWHNIGTAQQAFSRIRHSDFLVPIQHLMGREVQMKTVECVAVVWRRVDDLFGGLRSRQLK